MPPEIAMSRVPLLTLVAFAGLLIAPGAACAHGIESNLERLGGLRAGVDFSRTASGNRAPASRLQLQSNFSSGVPASEAAVRLVPPNGGTPIELGRTDTRGQLTFVLPTQASNDWEIQVDAGPGHRDYLELPGSENSGGVPHAGSPLPRAGSLASRWHILSPLVVIGLIGGVGGVLRWRRHH
jgi:nickel transport protein